MSTVMPGVGLPTQRDLEAAFESAAGPQFQTKPSRGDLMEQLRQAERPFTLYRYGQRWYRMELGGQDYWFPPVQVDADGKTKMVPSPRHADAATGRPLMVAADGIVIDQSGNRGIRTRYGVIRDMRNRARPIGFGPLQGEGHTDLVILAVENHGEFGVVWLPGDESDAARRRASKALYFKTIKTWAEEQDQARQSFLRNWHNMSGNKGRIPPPPSAVQKQAIDILDEIRAQARGGAEWICPHGCSEWNEFEKYANHMKQSHGKTVIDPKQDAAGKELVATGIPLPEMQPEDDEPPLLEADPALRAVDAAAQDRLSRLATQPPPKQKRRAKDGKR